MDVELSWVWIIIGDILHVYKLIDMEYELYLYCTGMGTLIIFLIVLYHCLGNEEKQVEPIPSQAPTKKVWFVR